MSSFSYIRQPQPFGRKSSPTEKTQVEMVDAENTNNVKAQEEALLAEIDEIRDMGSSIPEDEARAMIASIEKQLTMLKKNTNNKSKSTTGEFLSQRLVSVEKTYNIEVDSLRAKMKDANNSLRACKSIIKEQESAIEAKENDIAELKSKVNSLSNEIENLRCKIIEQRKMLKTGKSKSKNVKQLEELAFDQETFIEKLSKDIDILERERLSFNSRLSFANASKIKLKESNAELAQQLKDALRIESALNDKLEERDKTIQSLKEDIAKTLVAVSNHEDLPPAKNNENFDAQISDEEMKILENVNIEKPSEIMIARINQLSESCSVLEQREKLSREIAFKEIVKLKVIIDLLKKEIEKVSILEMDKTELQLKIEQLQKNHECDQEANATSVRAMQRVMKELSENKDSDIRELKDKIDSLNHSNIELENQIQTLKSEATSLLTMETQVDDSGSSTLVGIAASGVAASLFQKQSFTDSDFEINQLEKEIEQLHEENVKLQTINKTLKSEQRQEIDDNDALQEANIEIEELDKEIEILQNDNANLRKRLDNLDSSNLNATMDNGLTFYENEIEEMSRNVMLLEQENKKLKERLCDPQLSDNDLLNLSSSLASQTSTSILNQRIEALENENDDEKDQVDTLFSNDSFGEKRETDINFLSESAIFQEKNKALQSENKKLKNQISQLLSMDQHQQESILIDKNMKDLAAHLNSSSKDMALVNVGTKVETDLSMQNSMDEIPITHRNEDASAEVISIMEEEHISGDDSETADFVSDYVEEIYDLKAALHESTGREVKFTREIHRLNELLKVQETRQHDSMMISQDESTLFPLLNDLNNTLDQQSNNDVKLESREKVVVSPEKENDRNNDWKFLDEIHRLKEEISHRDNELDEVNKVAADLKSSLNLLHDNAANERETLSQSLETKKEFFESSERIYVEEIKSLKEKINHLDNELEEVKNMDKGRKSSDTSEQDNASNEKEPILQALKTKSEALENAKMIIASLQQARSDSLQTLKSDLSKKQEEINSLQNKSEEETKRSGTLQSEIKSLKQKIATEYTLKSNIIEEERTKGKIASTLVQISHAVQNPFFACIDAGPDSINPMEENDFKSYKTSILLDEDCVPLGENVLKSKQSSHSMNSQNIQEFEDEIKYLESALDESNDVIDQLERTNLEQNQKMEKLFEERKHEIEVMEKRTISLEKKVKDLTKELRRRESNDLRADEGETCLVGKEISESRKPDLERLQGQLNFALEENKRTKHALALTEESLRNAKMIISSLEKSNKRILDDFKIKSQQRSDDLSNLDSVEKDKSMLNIQSEFKELLFKKDKEIKSLEAKMRKLREATTENENKIFEQDQEIRQMKYTFKTKSNDVHVEGRYTEGSKSIIRVSSDEKNIRKMRRNGMNKTKTEMVSSTVSSSKSFSPSRVPRSPSRNLDSENIFESETSTSMLLADDDSDASYDEKKLMRQYMERNNIASYDNYEELECEI